MPAHARTAMYIRTRGNGTATFIQQKLYGQLPTKFKLSEIKVLYGTHILGLDCNLRQTLGINKIQHTKLVQSTCLGIRCSGTCNVFFDGCKVNIKVHTLIIQD